MGRVEEDGEGGGGWREVSITSGGGSIHSSPPFVSSARWRVGLLELLVENSTFFLVRVPELTAGE